MQKLIQFLAIVLVSVVTLSCSEQSNQQKALAEPICLPSQSPCVFQTQFGKVSILFNRPKITTEQEFTVYLKLDSSEDEFEVKGFLEGKTMYMGKIPLIFTYEAHSGFHKAQSLIGSCSEAVMRWQMQLFLSRKQPQENKVAKLTIEFDSERH